MLKWAHGIAKKTYTSEVALLSSQEHGLHYMTRGMTEDKLKNGVTTKIILSSPSARAINRAIQNDKVFPAPVAAQPTTSFPAWSTSTILIWYQHGRLPNFSWMRSRISLTDYSRGMRLVMWGGLQVNDNSVLSGVLPQCVTTYVLWNGTSFLYNQNLKRG